MTEQKTPALPSQCQKGVPLRRPLTSDFPSGSEYLPMRQMPFGFADLRGRKIREIVLQIAGQEVINIMFAGIHPGLKRGPRDRRNRGEGRSQRTKGAVVAQLGQIRKFALVHETAGQYRIHAVEAHDDHPLYLRLAVGLAPPEHSQQLANGPGHKRVKGIKEGDKDGPERR